jgi:hypothetical protein
VGVEPTILAAEDRINGFEGHEGHRTPFASAVSNNIKTDSLLQIDGRVILSNLLGGSSGGMSTSTADPTTMTS